MEPEDQGVGIGGVDARGGRVGPQELAGGVLDQLLGIAPAEPLGCVLVQGRDVVALGCPDDGTEGSWRVVGTAGIFPRLPHRIKRTWKTNSAQGKAAGPETPERQCFLVEYLCVLWLWKKKVTLENDTTQDKCHSPSHRVRAIHDRKHNIQVLK